MTTKELVFGHIKDQLAGGQLEAAISEIQLLSPNRAITRELKKYQFLLSRLRKLLRQGAMAKQEFHLARNKVHLALLEVLWEVEAAPSSLGLLAAALRMPLGWKIAVFSPITLAIAAYFFLAYPYPFEQLELDELIPSEQQLNIEEQQGELSPEVASIFAKRVGP